MATVHVFVGQCGTQVGSTFLDAVASEAEASTDEGFQMRVSATHFRPAMRPPRRRRGSVAPQSQQQPQSSSSRAGATRTPRRRTDETANDSPAERPGRAGPHHYYSLSRYTRYPAAAGASTENEEAGALIEDEANRQKEALPQPRCVLVDMEPKVIDSTLERANAWGSDASSAARRFYTLAPQQCVTRGEGSGNNWAFGYHQQGQSRREAIAECLRRESEQQGTTVSTFHVMHSIAGGTGSGVGCLVAEEIKAAFPSATLLHSVVWPFRCGEVVTQWYNVLMAVSTLRDLADGVCIAYNDVVAAELRSSRAHLGFKDAGEVSFSLINQRISAMLAPLHLPQLLYATPVPLKDASKNRIAGSNAANEIAAAAAAGGSASASSGTVPRRYATSSDIVEALTLDPAIKFFTGVAAPRLVTGSSTWTAVIGEAARTAQTVFTSPSAFDHLHGTASVRDASAFYLQQRCCLWSLRGRHACTDGIRELRHVMATSASPFPLTSLFVSPAEEWRETPSCHGRPDHAATLYGPTPMIGETLAEAARKAEELIAVGAFVHHFERYGVSKAELKDAAAVLWDTAAAYGE